LLGGQIAVERHDGEVVATRELRQLLTHPTDLSHAGKKNQNIARGLCERFFDGADDRGNSIVTEQGIESAD